MICKVKQAIDDFHMLSGEKVTVGLSGGADSVALLAALLQLREEYGITLRAAHINHCLRGAESDADEHFVRKLCAGWDIPLAVKRADVAGEAEKRHIGLEECGRQIRYGFFSTLDTDKIATAHTLSDSVETMLINLSRGCSLSGLCGIPPVRGNIIRPLIYCTGDEVRQYCRENGLSYVVDSSNNGDEYLRNRIRHTVIPAAEGIAPLFTLHAGKCIASLRDDNALLEELTDGLLQKAEIEPGKYDIAAFLAAPPSLLRRALYRILYEAGGVMPERKHIELLNDAMKSSSACQLCAALRCECHGGILYVGTEQQPAAPWRMDAQTGKNRTPYSTVTLLRIDRVFYGSLSAKQKAFCFDGDKLKGKLYLRSRKEGDKLTDLHRGNTKTLKKLFIEKKIPACERNTYALLCDEDTVITAEGFCTDGKYTVQDSTENIFYITFERDRS